ncbi:MULTISPECIES: hypothetical protein [unclassified Moorena]|uniref:hypothetical protein n=1 Tax=unclassified Moorena TaxID=2683338 RepID=UPI0013C6F60A|nr:MULTISPECIES: hypothetical protein [unclassified Moorena]NEO21085.1 hypothetical protein [Moorena sp. SIO4A5]NEQ56947.1 hypothetical protein [Moorena sp. SIO4A1]
MGRWGDGEMGKWGDGENSLSVAPYAVTNRGNGASCCGTGILLWNGHLAVERASCCGTGILPVINIFIPGRMPTPLIHIDPKIQQCQIFYRFPTPDSRFPIP